MTLFDRTDWPIHQPGPAWEAPIPGVHWYSGCEPGYPRVDPATGICEGCGGRACPECGREACPDHEQPDGAVLRARLGGSVTGGALAVRLAEGRQGA